MLKLFLLLALFLSACGTTPAPDDKYICKSMDYAWEQVWTFEPLDDVVTWQFGDFWVSGTLTMYDDKTYYFDDGGLYSHWGRYILYCDSLMFLDYFDGEHWYE